MADKKNPRLKLVSNNENIQATEWVDEPPAPCEGQGLEIGMTVDPAMARALLEASGVEFVDATAEVIDFEVERASRVAVDNSEVSPATVLKMALEDVTTGAYKNCTKAYVTLVLDNGKMFSTCNYRANLSRIEEVAFRQLGVAEAIEGWRGE